MVTAIAAMCAIGLLSLVAVAVVIYLVDDYRKWKVEQ